MNCAPGHMLAFLRRGSLFFTAPSLTRQNAMRFRAAIISLAFFAATVAADAAPLPVPHQVDIPSGSGVLHAQLYKPDGNGPFPVVIALHGCGGLAGHSEPVQLRYRDWAEPLLKQGRGVLLPDSYASREVGPQCQPMTASMERRSAMAVDIVAALEWV